MVKVAVVVLSDTETHADRARVANALTTAYEFKEAGDEVDLILPAPVPNGSPTVGTGPSTPQGFRAGKGRGRRSLQGLRDILRRQGGGAGQRHTAADGVQGPSKPARAGGPGLPGDHLLTRCECREEAGAPTPVLLALRRERGGTLLSSPAPLGLSPKPRRTRRRAMGVFRSACGVLRTCV